MIPLFDVANEDSEAGLWYKVIRELSDKFVFINQFRAGWLIQSLLRALHLGAVEQTARIRVLGQHAKALNIVSNPGKWPQSYTKY